MRDPIDVRRPRALGALIADAAMLLGSHLRLLLLLAAAVVVPVDLIVSGIGLGQLTSDYDASPPLGATVVELLVAGVVTTPLITAMVVTVVLDLSAGRAADPRRAWRAALDIFAPLVLVVVLGFVGIALGLLALVVPGVILALRWSVSAQAVVVEGHRGRGALRRSWELTQGRALYVLGVLVVSTVVTGVAGLLVSAPADALAKSADLGIIVLLASMLVNVFSLAYSALVSTLLYATLRAEQGQPLTPQADATDSSASSQALDRDTADDLVPSPAPSEAPASRPAPPGEDPDPPRPGHAPAGWEPPRPG